MLVKSVIKPVTADWDGDREDWSRQRLDGIVGLSLHASEVSMWAFHRISLGAPIS